MRSPIDVPSAAYPTPPGSRLARTIDRLADVSVAVLFSGEPEGGRRWIASTLHLARGSRTPLVEIDGRSIGERSAAEQHGELDAACERAAFGSLLIQEPGQLAASVQLEAAERIDLPSPRATRILAVSSGCGDSLQRALSDRLIAVDLPPLRTRDADLEPLLEYYLEQHTHQSGIEMPWGVERALAYLRGYRWPAALGDINSFAAAAVRQRDARVAARHEVRRLTGAVAGDWARQPKTAALEALEQGRPVRLKEIRRLVVRDAERSWLVRTLESVAGDRHRAAALLGISYKALSTKLRGLAPLHPSG